MIVGGGSTIGHVPKTASREPAPLTPYSSEHDPRWARTAHRLTGVVLLLALFAGVVVVSLLRFSPDTFNTAVAWVGEPVGVVGLIVVVSAGIFYGINAARIAIVDLTTWGAQAGTGRAAAFLPVVVVLWLALTAAAAYAIGGYTAAELWGTR